MIQQDAESWSRIVTPTFCSLPHVALNTERSVPKLSWRTVGVKVGCTAAIVKLWILVNEHMGFLCAEEEKMKPGW